MPEQAVINKDFYIYTSNIISIAAAASASDNINIEADSDFYLQKLSFFADVAAAAQTDSSRVLPLVTIQITDTGSGRQLFSSETPIPAVFGYGSIPFILPNPRRFAANSVISIAYTNYEAVNTYQLYLAFIGMKIYRR